MGIIWKFYLSYVLPQCVNCSWTGMQLFCPIYDEAKVEWKNSHIIKSAAKNWVFRLGNRSSFDLFEKEVINFIKLFANLNISLLEFKHMSGNVILQMQFKREKKWGRRKIAHYWIKNGYNFLEVIQLVSLHTGL